MGFERRKIAPLETTMDVLAKTRARLQAGEALSRGQELVLVALIDDFTETNNRSSGEMGTQGTANAR